MKASNLQGIITRFNYIIENNCNGFRQVFATIIKQFISYAIRT